MDSKNIFKKLRQFDAYPKTLEDFRIKTFTGATVTIISGIFMLVLFVSELNFYLTKEIVQELFVDVTKGQKLKINIDITFNHMGCSALTIDAMDVSGEQQIDIDHDVSKQRIDIHGNSISDKPLKEDIGKEIVTKESLTTLDPNRCESCYGAENAHMRCCNTCEDVKSAYRQKGWAFSKSQEIIQCKRESGNTIPIEINEGCRIYGYLQVNKVAGNFHIAPGRSFVQNHIHVHDMQNLAKIEFNTSHKITHLSFGQDYPGQENPLDNSLQLAKEGSMMFHYYVKIVPTTYVKIDGETIFSNQYSVTRHQKVISGGFFGEQGLPGTFFTYELSPMMIKYTEKHRSFMHFLTGVCAIIGGIFTVAGIIDSLVYRSSRVIQQKLELGKAT